MTRVNGVDSELGELSCGVPQGSILGPLIFILYLNDLPRQFSESQCYLYADDTAIVCTGTSQDEVMCKLGSELTLASTWLKDNKLSLNLLKTKVMFFGTNHKLNMITSNEMQFEDKPLEIVDNYKYLGVMLDSKLCFDKHVNYLHGKIYPKLKMLSRIRCNIGQGTAIYLYNCLINPLFTFSDVVYDCMTQTDAKKLQVLQNNCIRVCLKCDRLTPRHELYSNSGIKPLEVQRKEHTCAVVYQGLNQESTPYINKLFTRTSSTSQKVTRSTIQGAVFIPCTKLNISWSNIRVHGPRYYNDVPVDIREAKTLKSFKNRLKRACTFDTSITWSLAQHHDISMAIQINVTLGSAKTLYVSYTLA